MIEIRMNKVEGRGETLGFANIVVRLSKDNTVSLRGLRVTENASGKLTLRPPYNQYKKKDKDIKTPYFRTGVKLTDSIISEFEKFIGEEAQYKNVKLDYPLDGITVKVNSLVLDENIAGSLQAVFSVKFLEGEDLLIEMREIREVKKRNGESLFVFPSYLKEKGDEKIRYNIHFPMNKATRENLIAKMQESK